jgi:ubiquitin carboxyl-terminal hydrolase 7
MAMRDQTVPFDWLVTTFYSGADKSFDYADGKLSFSLSIDTHGYIMRVNRHGKSVWIRLNVVLSDEQNPSDQRIASAIFQLQPAKPGRLEFGGGVLKSKTVRVKATVKPTCMSAHSLFKDVGIGGRGPPILVDADIEGIRPGSTAVSLVSTKDAFSYKFKITVGSDPLDWVGVVLWIGSDGPAEGTPKTMLGKFQLEKYDGDGSKVVSGRIQLPKESVEIPLHFKVRANEFTEEEGWLNEGTAFIRAIVYGDDGNETIQDVQTVEEPTVVSTQKNDSRPRDNLGGTGGWGYTNTSYSSPAQKTVDHPAWTSTMTGKSATGYVGLKNQGATCYMNSMLQSFFCTPAFRRFVFEIPTTGMEDVSKSIPLCLQRLFAKMQLGDEACSTAALTKSFGWDREDTFVQHDVLEFCRVLMDNLETKMKGTPLEGVIAGIFRGKWRKVIRAINVSFVSQNEQYFYDLPLQVRGCATLEKSFEDFIAKEVLNGDNQYRTEQYGMQDVEMGTEFLEFPSVLHLQLSRWEYDQWGRSVKINARFEFPATIDLSRFLASDADRSRSAVYDLYGVLVHSGSVVGGHYYAYLRPTRDGQWLQFNDSTVSPSTAKQALDDNFGGSSYGYSGAYAHDTSASGYMLVYVRKEDAPLIFSPIDESLIPAHLKEYVKRGDDREAATSGSRLEFEIASEECIRRNAANGKSGWAYSELHKKASFVTRVDTNDKLYQKAAELFDIPLCEVRIWSTYSQFIPYAVALDTGLLNHTYYVQLLVQRKPPDEPVKVPHDEVVYFMKFFHPSLPQPLQYIGTHHTSRQDAIASLFPVVAERLGFPAETTFLVFEEATASLKRLKDTDTRPNGYGAASVIFQLEPGTPLPETSYTWAVSDTPSGPATPARDDSAASVLLPVKAYSTDAAETVDLFLKNTIEAVVYTIEAPRTPVCRVTFPATITLSQFKTFVASALGISYDPATAAMTIYKKDRNDADKPDTTPIREYANYGLTFEFSANVATEYRIWVDVNNSVSEADAALQQAVTVEYQASLDSPPTAQRVFVPKDGQLDVFREKLVEAGITSDATARVYRLYDHKIDRLLTTYEKIYSTDLTVFVTPADFGADAAHVLKGVHAVYDTYLRGILSPFFIRVTRTETVPDFLARVKQFLQLEDADYKKLRFMLGTQYAQYSHAAVLKGDKTMGEAMSVVSTTADVYLFVIHPSDRKVAASRDPSLRIYN